MDTRREYQQSWKNKNPDYFKDYYKKNRDKLLSKSKQRYHDNKNKNTDKDEPEVQDQTD